MDIIDIPFAQKLGLQKSTDGIPGLCFESGVMNHLGTIAAGAQFSLAELASGEYLIKVFPELIDTVIPVLRDSYIKYKRPASSEISAYAYSEDKNVEKFRESFERKGRGIIDVHVDVKDKGGKVTSSGRFCWYIQRA